MDANKKRNTIRIALSSAALILFVLYALCDNLIVRNYMSYHTYGWRIGVINDIILLIPIAALFIFSICERKLKHVNGRTYIVGVFLLYMLQYVTVKFFSGSSDLSLFCNDILGNFSLVVTIVMWARLFMLILLPVAHRIALKLYSVGMIAVFGFAFIFSLADVAYDGTSAIGYCVSTLVEILFHVALYYFSDLMTNDNESSIWMAILGFISFPIFGNPFEDDEDSELETEDNENNSRTDLSLEYRKIAAYALHTESLEFLKIDSFLENLANGNFTNAEGVYYPDELFVETISALREYAVIINDNMNSYVSETFISLLDSLLAEKEQATFKLDVVTIAKVIVESDLATWISATAQFDEHKPATETEDN